MIARTSEVVHQLVDEKLGQDVESLKKLAKTIHLKINSVVKPQAKSST